MKYRKDRYFMLLRAVIKSVSCSGVVILIRYAAGFRGRCSAIGVAASAVGQLFVVGMLPAIFAAKVAGIFNVAVARGIGAGVIDFHDGTSQ